LIISCVANTAGDKPGSGGGAKVDADFNLLAAAANLARVAVLKLNSTADGGWAVAA
jgi:hypothetical protein